MANNIDMQVWQDEKEIIQISVETGYGAGGNVSHNDTLVGNGTVLNPLGVSPQITTQIDNNTADIASNVQSISELSNEIQSAQNAISMETSERESADTNLQTQIDAISASSDVVDIVGTYSELESYDTTTLTNNSIIKVLQDDTHDDETTYYRWVITSGVGTWEFVGGEGPYYTRAQTDTLLADKQDLLAVSSNLDLNENTISLGDRVVINNASNDSLETSIVIGATEPDRVSKYSVLIGHGAYTLDSETVFAVAVGAFSQTSSHSVAIGNSAHARDEYSIAIGDGAQEFGKHSIQLGPGSNIEDGVFYVGLRKPNTPAANYKMLDASGIIPVARLADTADATQGHVLSLDSNLNAVWTAPTGGSTITMRDWSTVGV